MGASSDEYQGKLKAEAEHWDEFEKRFVSRYGRDLWWIDLRNERTLGSNSAVGLSSHKENLTRGRYKRLIINSCRSGDRVLDIGCGSGWLSLELARKGCRVIAVDISPYRIELAKSYFRSRRMIEGFTGTVDYLCADIHQVEISESLDAIVTWDSLHHLPSLDKLVGRLKSFLKPGGYFLCYDHRGSNFLKALGGLRHHFVREPVSAFEDVSAGQIETVLTSNFRVLEKRYQFSVFFRLSCFLFLGFDIFQFLIPPLSVVDDFLSNRVRIFGGEFVFIKGVKIDD